MNFHIEKALFQHFPAMKIIAIEVKPIGVADTEKISALLDAAWQSAGEAAKAYAMRSRIPSFSPGAKE